MIRTRVAALAITAALGGGGVATTMMFNSANAATGDTTTATPSGSSSSTGANPQAPADRTAQRTAKLTTTLQGLVDNGTITSTQRDAVVKALVAAAPTGGFGRGGMRGAFGTAGLDAAAKALGTDTATLQASLKAGTSIAAYAATKNVPVADVITAITTAESTQIDQAVTAGKLTAAQATQAKSSLTQRVTALVNGTRPAGMNGGFGRGHRRGGSGSGATTPSAPSTSAPATTTPA